LTPDRNAELLPTAQCCQALQHDGPDQASTGEDIPALVQLRLANARRHIELGPSLHRLPEASAVYQYFHDALSSPDTFSR